MYAFLLAGFGALVAFALSALSAFVLRLRRVGPEMAANDRAIALLDDHLETWVCDDTFRLIAEVKQITERLNAKNLLHSGAYGAQVAAAKERALHAYRDQERTAKAHAAEIIAREGWMAARIRARKGRELRLHAPERVAPILGTWAAAVVAHAPSQARAVDDPRLRTVESTRAFLAANPRALD